MVDVSFIIPVYNEERYFRKCLLSIESRAYRSKLEYEVIVIDNGSTDRSKEIAKEFDVDLFEMPRGVTIGAVRNFGVSQSSGSILVFLDSDVALGDRWFQMLYKMMDRILEEKIITGSTYGLDPDAPWVARCWYEPILNENKKYINGGHLIISREFFDELGGFSEVLKTGEDSDFGGKVLEAGGKVINDPRLQTIHYGYPGTLWEFFKRERWHATGNFQGKNIFRSKVSIVLLVMIMLAVVSLVLSIALKTASFIISYVILFVILSVLFAYKRGGTQYLPQKTVIAMVWFAARMSYIFTGKE